MKIRWYTSFGERWMAPAIAAFGIICAICYAPDYPVGAWIGLFLCLKIAQPNER